MEAAVAVGWTRCDTRRSKMLDVQVGGLFH